MAFLNPDVIENWYGCTMKRYLLTEHNPNGISMPYKNLPSKIRGITVHNTESISTASGTTMAEQYTRATVNGNMNDVRVHFYVDDVEAWQNLPLSLTGWHAADGDGDGNMKTVAIECIMNGENGERNEKAEENCARIVAWLLDYYDLPDDQIYAHSYWYSGKTCPLYILPHWNQFKEKCVSFRSKNQKPQDVQKPQENPTPVPVIPTQINKKDVCMTIQAYLNDKLGTNLTVDGICGVKTLEALDKLKALIQ